MGSKILNSDFSPSVDKIVKDHLDRVSARLMRMARPDHNELPSEIRSQIFESYSEDPTPDEIERIPKLLRKLGEPAGSNLEPNAVDVVPYRPETSADLRPFPRMIYQSRV